MRWNCRKCHQSFDNRTNLLLHFMNGNCRQPTVCHSCDYTVPKNRRDLLERHILSRHPTERLPSWSRDHVDTRRPSSVGTHLHQKRTPGRRTSRTQASRKLDRIALKARSRILPPHVSTSAAPSTPATTGQSSTPKRNAEISATPSTPATMGQLSTPKPVAKIFSVKAEGTPVFTSSNTLETTSPAVTETYGSSAGRPIVALTPTPTASGHGASGDEKASARGIPKERTSSSLRGPYAGRVNDENLTPIDRRRLRKVMTQVREQARPLKSVVSSKKMYFATRVVERATLPNGIVYERTAIVMPDSEQTRICRNVAVQTESPVRKE